MYDSFWLHYVQLQFVHVCSEYRAVNRNCTLYECANTSQCYWASEASPTLGCSIEISRDIYIYVGMYVCRMSNHVESRESNTRMLKVSIGR